MKYLKYLLFPRRCAVCNKVIYINREFCDDCVYQLRPIPDNIAYMLISNPNMNKRAELKPVYDGVAAPYYHSDGSKSIIYNYKFKGRIELAEIISREMKATFDKYLADKGIDIICNVPMLLSKKISTGYDHVAILAKRVSKETKLIYIPLLRQLRKKTPQHSLNSSERMDNIKGVFGVLPKYDIKGKNIVVVDDIMTTGATINECAKLLKRAGANRVYGLFATINI